VGDSSTEKLKKVVGRISIEMSVINLRSSSAVASNCH
jgi:hypothetical protein